MNNSPSKPCTPITRRAFGGMVGASFLGHALARRVTADLVPPTLVPFPATAVPFDAEQRRSLARDAMVVVPHQAGPLIGRPVNFLPVPMWLQGTESAVPTRDFHETVSAGLPLYLIANADDSGQLDASSTVITVNGSSVGALDTFIGRGIAAPSATGRIRDYAVLDVIFTPPTPGRYVIEVRNRASTATVGSTTERVRAALQAKGVDETKVTYTVTVTAPDAFAPLFLRDPDDEFWVLAGGVRRRLPNEATRRMLATSAHVTLPANHQTLALIPVGEPVPSLTPGSTVQGSGSALTYHLGMNSRTWVRTGAAPSPTTIDLLTVQSVPLALTQDLLLRSSAAPDVYHVDDGTLRKVPDWKWVTDHGLAPEHTHMVADWFVPTLPQGSPEWMMPSGSWTDRTFESTVLGRTVPYRILLPKGYDRSSTRYPVLYALHGMSARYDEWSGYGIEEVASELAFRGKIGGFIIVAPQGGLGYWVDQEDGGTPWGQFVARDLVTHIDTTFRTVAKPEGRAIGGLSMGGYGALSLALQRPDLFGVVGAHSPSIRDQASAPVFLGTGSGFERRDPIALSRTAPVTSQKFWVDAGRDDPWRSGADTIRASLQERGWRVSGSVFDGGHDGWYWGDHLWEYLQFYADSFAKNGVAPGA